MQNRWLMTLTALAVAAPAAFAGTTDAQQGVDAITLYSHGAAVVQDSRTVDLDQGEQTLTWPVAGQILPDTLWVSGAGVMLDGFSLSTDGGQAPRLLAGRIGKSVQLQAPGGVARQGTLLDVEGGTAYVRIADRVERVTATSPVQISWPAAGSVKRGDSESKARVIMHVSADKPGQTKLTALYQTNAPGWQASYTARFEPAEDSGTGKLELSATAVIDNKGHDELNAEKAWLVAGDVARANDHRPRPMVMMAASKKASADFAPAGQPQAVGHVYRYPLPGGLHVPAGTVQSIALMKPFVVAATRHYRIESYALSDSGKARRHAQTRLLFDNTSGQPLPAGVMRVYDAGHAAQLLGAVRMGDTPENAPVRLTLGSAFDVTATHRVVDKTHSDGGATTVKVRVDLFNAGDQAKQVTVVERLPAKAALAGDAPQTSGGSPNEPEWQVSVPANGHQTLEYSFTRPGS